MPHSIGLRQRVVRALGVQLPSGMQARMKKATRNFPPTMMPSMAVDLLRGNRLELPWPGGQAEAIGEQLCIPTPVFAVLNAALELPASWASA